MTDDSEALEQAAVWGRQYSELKPLHDAFSDRLAVAFRDLLTAAGITFSEVTSRGKTVDSFVKKILRKGGKYGDPLREMTDLSGCRIVVPYVGDLDAIGDVLGSEFVVDSDNTLLRNERLDPDRFGYLSDHYVLSISEARKQLGDWRAYDGLKVEVQVRTIVQHAWALIDHRLKYKAPRDIPREVQRKLFRISALLEVADSEFDAVRAAVSKVETRYAASVAAGDLSLHVDASSLEIYLERTHADERWMAVAVEIGYDPPNDSILVEHDRNDDPRGSLSELVRALDWGKVRSLREFDDLLIAAEVWGRRVLEIVFRNYSPSAAHKIYVTPLHVLTTLVLHGAEVPIATISSEYSDAFAGGIERARREVD